MMQKLSRSKFKYALIIGLIAPIIFLTSSLITAIFLASLGTNFFKFFGVIALLLIISYPAVVIGTLLVVILAIILTNKKEAITKNVKTILFNILILIPLWIFWFLIFFIIGGIFFHPPS